MGEVQAEVCPSCRSSNVERSEKHPGLFACVDCGSDGLVRMKRESRLGWEQHYFVNPKRRGIEVHPDAKPRGHSLKEEA